MRKQALRQHDGSQVERAAVLLEATARSQATGSLGERRFELAHPRQRDIGGDVGCASQIGRPRRTAATGVRPDQFIARGRDAWLDTRRASRSGDVGRLPARQTGCVAPRCPPWRRFASWLAGYDAGVVDLRQRAPRRNRSVAREWRSRWAPLNDGFKPAHFEGTANGLIDQRRRRPGRCNRCACSG